MSFEYQPVLRGELVELRPLRMEDESSLYAVAADPLIWEQHPVPDRYHCDSFRAFFRESLASGGALIAIDRSDRQVIGSARFHGFDEQAEEVEIGWVFLARSHWGGVYNREMTTLMLRHALRFASRVLWLAGTENIRSQRAVERLGGVRVGIRPDDGGQLSHVYELTESSPTSTGEDQTGA